jgi:hypothetical protein
MGPVFVQGTGKAICIFLFVGFCEGQSLGPPTANEATGAQDKSLRSLWKIDHGILRDLWHEVEYGFDVASVTRGIHIELN